MQRFDCLAPSCPLLGPHLLEASAGTGKTFSIEHLFIRLLLSSLKIEEILLVTFTKAATRELKERVRACLKEALFSLKKGENLLPYLQNLPNISLKLLQEALDQFDEAQIFTIHGFCSQMLQEFFFEAKIDFSSQEESSFLSLLRKAAFDFLEYGLDPSLISQEQISSLLKEYVSTDLLIEKLIQSDFEGEAFFLFEVQERCKAALQSKNVQEDLLLQDFYALEKNYKRTVKGNFEGQIKALFDPKLFPLLMQEKGSLFDFLSQKNQKVKVEAISFLHYPDFFEWAQESLKPFFKQKTFHLLQRAFQPVKKRIFEQEEGFSPDELLSSMHEKIQDPLFLDRVRKKYSALIIDEFQDTDALQWKIFQTLFLESGLKALYLVGDPKQSIYRFRKADIYTYLDAKRLLGEENHYVLDTNFRSSKPLIEALNSLFENKGFFLPKTKSFLLYYPVQAGANIEKSFQDGKGSIHFLCAEGEDLFEKAFLPYAVLEIEKLKNHRSAILVKDRYQAQQALTLLKSRGIKASAKSQIPLGKTPSFQIVEEFLKAVFTQHPNDIKTAMNGPLFQKEFCFSELKKDLQERGIVFFAKKLSLDDEMGQIFEHLFRFEKKEGFSFSALFRFLKKLKTLSIDEGGRKRMEVGDEGVQVMTLHISKGLEFDVVFALGLSTRTPQPEEIEEIEAEKLRQLYVAMTRAKKRLYVPFSLYPEDAKEGTSSPIELFASYFEKPFLDELQSLSQKVDLTYEKIQSPLELAPCFFKEERQESQKESSFSKIPFKPSFLSSFTSLSSPKEIKPKQQVVLEDGYTLQTMPKGAETGIEIHALFEALFHPEEKIFQDAQKIEKLFDERFLFSPLKSWKEALYQAALQILSLPLAEGVSLKSAKKTQVEMEFVFDADPNFMQGFIDLVFEIDQKIYLVDWKTNSLPSYDPLFLKQSIEDNDYALQARIYQEAVKRHFTQELGGIFYIFIRGPASFNLQGL